MTAAHGNERRWPLLALLTTSYGAGAFGMLARLRAGAAQPSPTHGTLNFLMGNDASSGRVRLTALDRLQDIQVVQHVLHAAVIGQSIEERSDRLLCLHQSSSFHQGLLPSTFYRKLFRKF